MDSPRSTTSSTESRPKLPASILNSSKEELQKTVQSLLRRLKQRDGQIKDFETRLASISETGTEDTSLLQREKASLEESLKESGAQLLSTQQHVQDLSNQLQELTIELKSGEEERTQMLSRVSDLTDQETALLEQVSSLKHAVQSSLEDKETAIGRLSEEKERNQALEEALIIAQDRLKDSTVPDGVIQDSKEDSLIAEKSQLNEEMRALKKENHQLQERVQEMEVELNQHKTALMRVTSQLEEASQEHRITVQRLSDEQKTSNQLKRELQDSLAKLQNSELEMWRKVESIQNEKSEAEDQLNSLLQDKEEVIKKLEAQLVSNQDLEAGHNEDIDRIKQIAETEKEKLKKAIGELRRRLDKATAQIKEVELEKVTLLETHSSEKDQLKETITSSDQRLSKVNLELKDYKAKAHLLVKGKDQEIQRLTEELRLRSENEMELKAMKEKLEDMTAEHDRLNEELTQANERFQVHLDDLMGDFHSQLNQKTATILDLNKACEDHQSIIAQWSEKCEKLEQKVQELESREAEWSKMEVQTLDRKCEKSEECESLKQELTRLQQEFAGYKRTMDRMSEMQQNEMSKLIQLNLDLRNQQHPIERSEITASEQDLNSPDGRGTMPTDSFQFEDLIGTRHQLRSEEGSLNESQIVALANKQAEREDTFQTLKKENDQLQNEVEELEKELQLHKEQEQVLKTALRAADELRQAQSGPPKNMDYQYLKNTVMKLITTGESEALLPVLAKLLNFTETEVESLTEEIQKSNKKAEELTSTVSLLPSFTGWPW